MSVNTQHPSYIQYLSKWQLMRDCNAGSDTIKSKKNLYLPCPSGMHGEAGRYHSYIERTEFPSLVSEAIIGAMGLVMRKPPTIRLTPKLQSLLKCACPEGLTLEGLFHRLLQEILLVGRVGLLADSNDKGEPMILFYPAESIINWRAARKNGLPELVVLEEMCDDISAATNPFLSNYSCNYLTLAMKENSYYVSRWQDLGIGNFIPQDEYIPLFNRQECKEIPFVAVGHKDLTLDPDGEPPFRGVAELALQIYQLSADLRQALYLTSQPTPYICGVPNEELPDEIGGGALWAFANPGARVGYLEFSGSGIEALRGLIGEKLSMAGQLIGKLYGQRQAETAEATRFRFQAQSSAIITATKTAGAGMERILRMLAKWGGENPEEVSFIPDLDFMPPEADPAMISTLIAAWKEKVIPIEAIWNTMRRYGITNASDEQLKEILK